MKYIYTASEIFIIFFFSIGIFSFFSFLVEQTSDYKVLELNNKIDFCTSNEGYIDYVDSENGWTYFCNEVTYKIN